MVFPDGVLPLDLADIVDLDRYAIADPGSAGFAAALAEARDGLEDDGCAVLKGFVRPAALAAMKAEGAALRAEAHPTDVSFTPYPPYHVEDDETWAADHVRRRERRRKNRFIGYDRLAPDSVLRALYETPDLTEFLRQASSSEILYPYGDPLGACALSVQEPGDELPWHFDLTHFVVSLLLHAPDEGGRFHYAPRLRSVTDENYDEVATVLDDDSPRIVDANLEPGDLQLFEGRHSMHRVTSPAPGTWRCIALLSYSQKPGVIGSEKMQRDLFGRILRPEQLAAAR